MYRERFCTTPTVLRFSVGSSVWRAHGKSILDKWKNEYRYKNIRSLHEFYINLARSWQGKSWNFSLMPFRSLPSFLVRSRFRVTEKVMQNISRRVYVIYNIFMWRRLWITSKTEFCVSHRGSEIVMMKLVPQAHRLLHVKEQAFCEAACGAFQLSTMLIALISTVNSS